MPQLGIYCPKKGYKAHLTTVTIQVMIKNLKKKYSNKKCFKKYTLLKYKQKYLATYTHYLTAT